MKVNSVNRLMGMLDWQKCNGKVMTIIQQEGGKNGGRILHADLFCPDEVERLFTGVWKHKNLNRKFEVLRVFVDCDQDALLLKVIPFVDASNVRYIDRDLRILGQCMNGCFDFCGHFSADSYNDDVRRGKDAWVREMLPKECELFPVIVADREGTHDVLMVAWMNEQAFRDTITSSMWYWSRSKERLWRKGEESGHFQTHVAFETHCSDVCLIAEVHQEGAACHEGYRSCFYREFTDEGLEVVRERIVDPEQVYKRG